MFFKEYRSIHQFIAGFRLKYLLASPVLSKGRRVGKFCGLKKGPVLSLLVCTSG